jgi:hypothetical protein
MFSRIRDRIAKLGQILPKPQSRVFELVIDDQSPLTRDEQIEAFMVSSGAFATDHLVSSPSTDEAATHAACMAHARRARKASYGGMTQTKWPPANPGRFKPRFPSRARG